MKAQVFTEVQRRALAEAAEGHPPPWLTRGRKKLIVDALKAGFKVRYSEQDVLIWKGHTHITRGVTLYPDGTAVRADIDLTVSSPLRRLTDIRQVLGL